MCAWILYDDISTRTNALVSFYLSVHIYSNNMFICVFDGFVRFLMKTTNTLALDFTMRSNKYLSSRLVFKNYTINFNINFFSCVCYIYCGVSVWIFLFLIQSQNWITSVSGHQSINYDELWCRKRYKCDRSVCEACEKCRKSTKMNFIIAKWRL